MGRSISPSLYSPISNLLRRTFASTSRLLEVPYSDDSSDDDGYVEKDPFANPRILLNEMSDFNKQMEIKQRHNKIESRTRPPSLMTHEDALLLENTILSIIPKEKKFLNGNKDHQTKEMISRQTASIRTSNYINVIMNLLDYDLRRNNDEIVDRLENVSRESFDVWEKMNKDVTHKPNAFAYLQIIRASVLSKPYVERSHTLFKEMLQLPNIHKNEAEKQIVLAALVEIMKGAILTSDGVLADSLMFSLGSYGLDPRDVLKNAKGTSLYSWKRKYQDLYENCILCLAYCGNMQSLRSWYREMIRLIPDAIPSNPMLEAVFEHAIYRHHSFVGEELIDILMRKRNPNALSLYDRLLDSAIQSCDSDVSFRVAKLICEQGGRFEQGQSLQLLNVASSTGNTEMAEFVFDKLIKWQFTITIDHCVAYLKALARGWKVEKVFQVINELVDLGLQFELAHLTPLVNEISVSSKRIDESYYTIEKLKSERKIHVESLNTIILACARIGDSKRALDTFSAIGKITQSKPDIISYNGLILCASHPSVLDVDLALKVFSMLAKKGTKPDANTFEGLILTHSRSGDIDTAKIIFAKCLESGVTPTKYTFDNLIRKFARHNQIKDATNLIEGMIEIGHLVHPSLKLYVTKMCKLYNYKLDEHQQNMLASTDRMSKRKFSYEDVDIEKKNEKSSRLSVKEI